VAGPTRIDFHGLLDGCRRGFGDVRHSGSVTGLAAHVLENAHLCRMMWAFRVISTCDMTGEAIQISFSATASLRVQRLGVPRGTPLGVLGRMAGQTRAGAHKRPITHSRLHSAGRCSCRSISNTRLGFLYLFLRIRMFPNAGVQIHKSVGEAVVVPLLSPISGEVALGLLSDLYAVCANGPPAETLQSRRAKTW
jgi:hypothetical protein